MHKTQRLCLLVWPGTVWAAVCDLL